MSDLVERVQKAIDATWHDEAEVEVALLREVKTRIEELERALRDIIDGWALVPDEEAKKGIGLGEDRWLGWAQDRARAALEKGRAAGSGGECGCWACLGGLATHMVLCPICGNKRCPHANDHRNACTGSNEPGQPGSAYP
jgi:hypothetical protein